MENELVGFACDLLDAPGRGGRHGHLGRHRVGACSPCRARATRAPTSTRPRMVLPATAHAAFHKAAHYFGVEARGGAGRPGLPGRRRRDGRRHRRRRTVLVVAQRTVVRPRRGRPGAPRSPPRPPRAGCAATSTPASAAGCCRTPPGWGAAGPAVDVRGRRRHLDLGGHSTSTPTPPRAPRSCCTARRRCGGRSTSPRADWPGYTMLNSTMQSTKSGGPLAGAWAVVQALGDEGYRAAGRRDVRGGRPDRRRGRRDPGARRWSSPPTPPWSPWSPTTPATRSPSATRCSRAGGTSSRRCRTPARHPTIHLSVSAATARARRGVPRAHSGRRWRRPSRPARSRSTRAWWSSSRRSTRRP